MDSAQPWASSASMPHTDLNYQRIFDAYLYEYLRKRNLLTSAEVFKQEAQIEDLRNSVFLTDSPGDFLLDWWAIFYEKYTARLNDLRGNQAALFSQFGQGSSTNDLTPIPQFLRDPGPRPLVHAPDSVPQAWLTPDSSPLIYGTCGFPHVRSAPNGSPLVASTGDIPPAWWALDGSVVPVTEQAPVPSVDLNLSSQLPGPSSAFVLTMRNLTSVSPTQFLQPTHPRRGIRRGSTPYDPIDVEAPMSSSSSAPRGPSFASRACRPRLQDQPLFRGSSLTGANWMPSPTSMPPSGFMSMSRAWMVGQTENYSRPSPFPALRANSAFSLMANFNEADGPLVPSSTGAGGRLESYGPGPLLSDYQAMLASTSTHNSDTQNAPKDQNSKPLTTGTLGLLAVGTSSAMNRSTSSQEMDSEKSSDVAKPGTVGQPSTPDIASNPQTDSVIENNAEVSSAMKNSGMKEAAEDGDLHKENDTNLSNYLNDNNGFEIEVNTSAVAFSPQPQPEVPQPQPQPSQLIAVRNEGFEFKLETCLESNLSELWCCHFSSSGNYLACAGIDRKVIVWNTVTFVYTVSEEHHNEAIADIRFKPNSSIFASASLDTTIRIWDADKPERALVHLTCHAASVTSVDFHPTNSDLLCSCDGNQELRFWNISNGTCLHVIKSSSQQVRFQTQKGKYLAAAAGNIINILDDETLTVMHTLKGHVQPVECICWDSSGQYMASASQECVQVWSVTNWSNSTHKLTAETGAKFKSCIFHPGIPHVLIIGSDKNIEIWNPTRNGKTLVVPAHESYVTGLTSSMGTDIIASAGHDGRLKLWK